MSNFWEMKTISTKKICRVLRTTLKYSRTNRRLKTSSRNSSSSRSSRSRNKKKKTRKLRKGPSSRLLISVSIPSYFPLYSSSDNIFSNLQKIGSKLSSASFMSPR